MYTALNTLQKGLIENVPETEVGADSRRKLYAITELGRNVLKAEMDRMEELLSNARSAISNVE